jgi:type IV pilus assembly protein PilV
MRRMNSHGFTLIEALIALLILSLGLLGAFAMLLDGFRANADAMRLMAATRLVRDMADRIRANPRAQGLYDTRSAAVASDCESGTRCDLAQRAAADREHFGEAARGLFPGGNTAATIEFEPAIGTAAPDRYTIQLRWRGTRESAGTYDAVTLKLLAPPVAG